MERPPPNHASSSRAGGGGRYGEHACGGRREHASGRGGDIVHARHMADSYILSGCARTHPMGGRHRITHQVARRAERGGRYGEHARGEDASTLAGGEVT